MLYESYEHAGLVDYAAWRARGIEIPVVDKDGTFTPANRPELIEEVVDGMREQGFADIYPQVAVVSNNHSAQSVHLFAFALRRELGVEVFSVSRAEGYRRKPDPEMGRVVAAHYDIAPHQLGIIGDRRLTDVSFGIKLGAGAIALCSKVGEGDAPGVSSVRILEAGIIGWERKRYNRKPLRRAA